LRRLLCLFLFVTVLAGCARSGSAPAKPPDARSGAAGADIVLRFAVYFLPEPKSDPVALARQIVTTDHSFLAIIERPGSQERPAVAIMPTDTAEFAPPTRNQLELFSRGLSAFELEALPHSKQVLVFLFLTPAGDQARVHAAALDLVGKVAERAGGVAWDEDTREVFGVGRWKERAALARESPLDIRAHITIHTYRDDADGLARLVTLGMSKFGLPDVSMKGVPLSFTDAAAALVNLVCQTLLEGRMRTTPAQVIVDLKTILNRRFRSGMEAALSPGASGRAEVALIKVSPEKGDADNDLVQIVFPDVGPEKQQEAIAGQLRSLFGVKDNLAQVDHDEELIAARDRARVKLLALKPRFQKGLAPGELLQVKVGFPVPSGGNEWMWVEVVEWNGSSIKGILQNTPFKVPDLKAGARVEAPEGEVFDYIFSHADGTEEGNETGEIMQRRLPKE
jgi:uncharacterized protein YegJ (DUF2314 family)